MPIERRILSLHDLDRSNGFSFLVIQVDGSAVTTTASATGLDVGSRFCTVKDDASNTVTITFNEVLPAAPIVFPHAITTNIHVNVTSATTSTIVYKTVDTDDTTSAQADADVKLLVIVPEGLDLG